MKVRKRPVVVEAFEFVGGAASPGWPEGWLETEHSFSADGCEVYIETLEGRHAGQLGDYIIKGIKGAFYPCKPDIFEATYEPAPEGASLLGVIPRRFDFSDAIRIMKRGHKVRRSGWNGKGMWIDFFRSQTMPDPVLAECMGMSIEATPTLLDFVAMKTVQNGLIPWLASLTDLLADDWEFVD